MTVREVFEQAREATISIRDVKVRSEVMHERIGVQGRAMESVFAQSEDPMRKVDDLLDWEAEEYRVVMQASREAIAEAMLVLSGMDALGAGEAAKTLRLVYVEAWTEAEVARSIGQTPELVRLMCVEAFSWCESVGLVKLKEAGRQ